MSVTPDPAARRRIQPIREHVYTLPVVRELPPKPPDPTVAQALW